MDAAQESAALLIPVSSASLVGLDVAGSGILAISLLAYGPQEIIDQLRCLCGELHLVLVNQDERSEGSQRQQIQSAHWAKASPGQSSSRSNALRSEPLLLDSDAVLDLSQHVLRCGSHEIELTAGEVAVLAVLASEVQSYHSSEFIARTVFGHIAGQSEKRCVVQIIYQLRRKLSQEECLSNVLRTRRGIGYGLFPVLLKDMS